MKKQFKGYEMKEFKSYRELLRRNILEKGDKPAVCYREKGKIKSVLFSEFIHETLCLGNALYEKGLSKKHIAAIGDNSYRLIVNSFTMLHSEGVYLPLDRQLPAEDIKTVLTHSDTEVLFFSKKYIDKIWEIKEDLRNIKHFICMDDAASEDYESYDDYIKRGEELLASGFNEYEKNPGDPDALRVLIYTSGTTGMPKGVMISENNLIQDIYNGLKLTRLYDKSISLLPYNHIYEAAGLLAELGSHVTICINDNIRNLMKNFEDYKPDSAFLVPAFIEVFYKRIWQKIGKKKPLINAMIWVSNLLRKCGIDVRRKMFAAILKPFGGNFKKIISGGAPIRPELAKFFEDIGFTVVNGYGISECSPLISITREGVDDCSTAGVLVPGTEAKILNPDENGIGEICVKGPQVMLGYYKNEEETNRVIKDGWFNTEDLGYIDGEGRILVTGRAKNLIVLKNGKNVFPEEIEKYIQTIPYVLEVAVTSIKSDEGDEVGLCAHVYLDQNSDEAKDEGIEKRLRRDVDASLKPLPKYKQVNRINIRSEEFVKTTSNKIKRNKIEA